MKGIMVLIRGKKARLKKRHDRVPSFTALDITLIYRL
jgi:hypothetical protein